MTQLTHVSILDHLDGQKFAGLLRSLSHLQQLQRIYISTADRQSQQQLPPGASYAALTASSQLTALKLSGCCMHRDAARHMFAAGRQLLHLHQLEIEPFTGLRSDQVHAAATLQRCSLMLQTGDAAQLVMQRSL
jgi:hypothetical protein